MAAVVLSATAVHTQGTPAKWRAASSSELVTLYTLDPVTSSFCLSENHAGGILADHHDSNNGQEIDFGKYHPGNLTVADSNGMTGAIVDLGTPETLQKEYRYHETVGQGQGFASIHRRGTSLLINKQRDDDSDANFQELKEGSQLFGDLKQLATAPVVLGHIYVLRVIGTIGKPVDFVAKLKVVAFQPDQAVTIRWEVLPDQ